MGWMNGKYFLEVVRVLNFNFKIWKKSVGILSWTTVLYFSSICYSILCFFFMVNSCLERRVSLQKHSNVFFKTLYLFLKWEQVGSKIFLYSVEIKFKDRGIKDDENRFQYFFNNKSNVILTNDMIISGLSFVIRIKYRILLISTIMSATW